MKSSVVPGINIGAPGLCVDFEAASGLTAKKVIAELQSGSPSIVVGEVDGALLFNPNTLHEGDEEVVAERLRSIVTS